MMSPDSICVLATTADVSDARAAWGSCPDYRLPNRAIWSRMPSPLIVVSGTLTAQGASGVAIYKNKGHTTTYLISEIDISSNTLYNRDGEPMGRDTIFWPHQRLKR
ncbi:hypothetical protein TNCV_3904041 [Trichonephila clavipes]|nr:hypothetical protein TNCV_3904041 [Trichonephila clavipes]